MLHSLKNLPSSAGIYQFFDSSGKLLYVGKAKDLSKRVKSYFSFTPHLAPNPRLSTRLTKMISETKSLNYIVVSSESDALILENSLIKQLNPKYNILLRDDKTYPYIYIDLSKPYPRFEITRKVQSGKDIKYFGPFAVGARDILDSLYELCKLVQKKGSLKNQKICLYHQLGKCLAPCELEVSSEAYQAEVDRAFEFIKNKKLLINELEKKMLFYAEAMRFEEAAKLRDSIDRIARSELKSEIDFATNENYDIFAIKHSSQKAVVLRLFMRDGKIISSSHTLLNNIDENYDEDELYERALVEFYQNNPPPVKAPILVAKEFETISVVSEYLSSLFGKKAHISLPKSGKKRSLIDLALLNCDELLRIKDSSSPDLMADLKELFGLAKLPHRIEIYDNSHFYGSATVGAMVVYENGSFSKASKRLYHLEAKDEYSQMRELLSRRIASFERNPPPDLWVLDGGSTLLKLALDLLHSSGVNLDVIAISKQKVDAKTKRSKGSTKDILHTKDDEINLLPSDKRLQFIQKLRDEAHRSAVSFHRQTKLKEDKSSDLLAIGGISQAKIVKLLQHFGTFEAIKMASEDELATILNKKDANSIKKLYS